MDDSRLPEFNFPSMGAKSRATSVSSVLTETQTKDVRACAQADQVKSISAHYKLCVSPLPIPCITAKLM